MALRLLRLLERSGSTRALLAKVPGGRAGLEKPGARVSWSVIDAWAEEAARRLGAHRVGPLLAQEQDPDTYGAAGLLMLTATTAAGALEQSVKFQREWGDPDRVFLDAREGEYRLRFQHPGASAVAGAVLAECALIESVVAMRLLTSAPSPARSVEFSHRRLGPNDELIALLGVTPQYARAANVAHFDDALLDRPLDGVLERATAAAESQARARVERVVTPTTLSAQVRALILGWFDEETPTQTLVAAQLKLTTRTLQRRLTDESTSFVALLDDARREQDATWTAQGRTAKDIAYGLGFSDLSGLTRARRRWHTYTSS